MSYDNWKTDNPYEDEKLRECLYCGEPSDETFCNKECGKAYKND